MSAAQGSRAVGDERCFYCDAPLSVRREYDHFPWPQRHGGVFTVPACVNCHDLKDRTDPLELLLGMGPVFPEVVAAWEGMSAPARIVVAKFLGLAVDAIVAHEAAQELAA